MVSLWPRRMKCEPRGRSFWCSCDDLLHGAGHAAQVGAFHVGVDVDDRLDVVVADVALLGAGHDGGQVAQHLHWRGRARARRWRLRRARQQRRCAGRAGRGCVCRVASRMVADR